MKSLSARSYKVIGHIVIVRRLHVYTTMRVERHMQRVLLIRAELNNYLEVALASREPHHQVAESALSAIANEHASV